MTSEMRAQVRAAVAECPEITHWAAMNEPDNFGLFGAAYADFQRDFHEDVKAARPAAVVLGPELLRIGARTDGPLRAFLDAGGGAYVEAASFHTYPGHYGSWRTIRRMYAGFFAVLAEYPGEVAKPRFLTEACDYYAADRGGGTQPAQAQRIMVDLLAAACHGVPKEHWYLFYWDEQASTRSRRGCRTPPAGSTRRSRRSSATPASCWAPTRCRRCSRWTSARSSGTTCSGPGTARPDGTGVVAFMSDGCADAPVVWNVTGGASSLVVVDGDAKTVATVPVAAGKAVIAAGLLPRYIRLPAGCSAAPDASNARMGTRRVPSAGSLTGGIPGGRIAEVIGAGSDVNAWYWDRGELPLGDLRADRCAAARALEAPVDLSLFYDAAVPMDLLVFEGGPGYRLLTSIISADVQARVDGEWVDVATIDDPIEVLKVASTKHDATDSWWEILTYKAHTFEVPFDERVVADAVRVRVYEVTAGQAPDVDAVTAYGQLDAEDEPVVAVGVRRRRGDRHPRTVWDTENGTATPADSSTRYVVKELPA